MNPNLDFAEQAHVVSSFLPLDMNSAGGPGDWISLKNYEKVTIIFFKGAGTDGDDPTITLQQKETVGSGSAIDLVVIDKIYVKQATDLLSTGTFTVRTQTAATDFVGDGTSAQETGLYIIDIYASDLTDGYTAIQAGVDNDLSNAQVGCMLYVLWPARYGEQTLLSAIA